MHKKALVIGGGVIGSHLVAGLVSCAGMNVVVIDHSEDVVKRFLAMDTEQVELKPAMARIRSACSGVDSRSSCTAAQSIEGVHLDGCSVIFVCVPVTYSPPASASGMLFEVLQCALSTLPSVEVVVIESTVPVGTIELLDERIRCSYRDRQIGVVYAPERVNPGGNDSYYSTDRVLASSSDSALRAARRVYRSMVCNTIETTNVRAAEASKLIENAFRLVNIALASEICHGLEVADVDSALAMELAATKPFGFMAFSPGYAGGPCLQKDSLFLCKGMSGATDSTPPIIEAALEANEATFQAELSGAIDHLGECKCGLLDPIGLVGVAYKPGVGDTRASLLARVAVELSLMGYSNFYYYDPFVQDCQNDLFLGRRAASPEEVISHTKATLFGTPHKELIASHCDTLEHARGIGKEDSVYCTAWYARALEEACAKHG